MEHFETFIAKNGLNKNKCAVVGDGDSDIALFRELPFGIAVNKKPHPELERLATQKIESLSQLREMF